MGGVWPGLWSLERILNVNPRVLGGKWFEGDAVAEGLELESGSLAVAVGVAADEVVATKVLVVTVVGGK